MKMVKLSKRTYTDKELEVVERLWTDFYNYPGRFKEDYVELQLKTVIVDDMDFEEFHIIRNALWLYRSKLLQLIKDGNGTYQNRSVEVLTNRKHDAIKDFDREFDEMHKVAKKYD